jgi:hypothetical protein
MVYLLGLGAAIWLLYFAFILRLGRALLGSVSRPRQILYWVLPVLVIAVITGVAELSLRLGRSTIHVDASVLFAAQAVVLIPACYLAEALTWGYIFRCTNCGTARSTYRVWWRRGIYRCPSCERTYFKGRAASEAV